VKNCEELEKRGLKIVRLEVDEHLQDLALSVFHATTHTFTGTGAIKIMENHLGRAFIKAQSGPQMIQMPPAFPMPVIPGPKTPVDFAP
jgi:hypothetical protein